MKNPNACCFPVGGRKRSGEPTFFLTVNLSWEQYVDSAGWRRLGRKRRLLAAQRGCGKFSRAPFQFRGRFSGAVVAQIAQDLLLFASVMAGQAGKSIGDDVAMVQ